MRMILLSVATLAALGACGQADHASPPPAETKAANAAAPGSATMGAMVATMTAAPIARDTALQVMKQRHEGMEQIGKATKAAGRTLKSSAPDAAVVRTSAATIARLAKASASWFPKGTGPDVGKTGSKPEIWAKPADFAAKTKAFQTAATAFDAAAARGDMTLAQARFAELGKTCKSCHEGYRSEMHK